MGSSITTGLVGAIANLWTWKVGGKAEDGDWRPFTRDDAGNLADGELRTALGGMDTDGELDP